MRSSLTILVLTAVLNAMGQNDSSKLIFDFSASYLYSSIWTGRTSLQQFKRDHPQIIQLDFGILKDSRRNWNYCNCYARNGVSVDYIDFGNSGQLGRAIAISPFTEPILFASKNLTVSLRAGAGLAFLSKLYDSISNKDAIFFSTKLSYLLTAGMKASYRVGDYLKVGAVAQFNHLSNGGKRDPNEGMNFPGIGVEVGYVLNPQKNERREKERFVERSTSLLIHTFGAQRTAQATSKWPEEVRWVTGVNVGLIRRIGRLNGIGGGGEIYYDGINSVYQSQSGRALQTTVGGLSIQHCLFFGKLLFGQQFAWYITPNTGYQKNIYQRYFLEYEVMRKWYAGVTLKAHGDHSDYLAISIGRSFKL